MIYYVFMLHISYEETILVCCSINNFNNYCPPLLVKLLYNVYYVLMYCTITYNLLYKN